MRARIVLGRSENNSIFANEITDTYAALHFTGSSYNSIVGNKITNNDRIWFDISNYNIISRNNVTANHHGVVLIERCSNNTIFANNVTANRGEGIVLGFSSNYNNISANNVVNNKYGIGLVSAPWGQWTYGNVIYHNNFINNTIQIASFDSVNVWDVGYPFGGNYWSDYNGTDLYSGPYQDEKGSDGIGDTPYPIPIRDLWTGEIFKFDYDYYPLMKSWTPPGPIEAIQESIGTIESWNLTKGTENSLVSKLQDVIRLLEMGNKKGAIHKLMDFIDQAKGLRGKKLTDVQADYLISEAQRIINLIEG